MPFETLYKNEANEKNTNKKNVMKKKNFLILIKKLNA